MKNRIGLATVLFAFVLSACATYTKVDSGQRVPVGDGITVTAVGDWASISEQLIAASGADAMWTVDGPIINQLMFFTRVESGESLREDSNTNPDNQLPTWRVGMTEPDIMAMVEGSIAKLSKAPLVQAENLRPQTFLSRPGFAFEYNMVTASQLEVRGLVIGTQAGGVLRLMIYQAPKLHYFAKDERSVRAIAASAQLAAGS